MLAVGRKDSDCVREKVYAQKMAPKAGSQECFVRSGDVLALCGSSTPYRTCSSSQDTSPVVPRNGF